MQGELVNNPLWKADSVLGHEFAKENSRTRIIVYEFVRVNRILVVISAQELASIWSYKIQRYPIIRPMGPKGYMSFIPN